MGHFAQAGEASRPSENRNRILRDAGDVKREIEAEYGAVLGAERMQLLHSALKDLLEYEEGKKQ